MIFIASLVLLLIIKLRFPKGKSIHRVIQQVLYIVINFAWRWNLKNVEILRQDDFHLFLDFSCYIYAVTIKKILFYDLVLYM